MTENNADYKGSYISKQAVIIGDVRVGEKSSVFWNAVIRGDNNTITIGDHSNIQENCVLHADSSEALTIGNYVTIGHGAILHGCSIGNNTLIGMGSIILDGAEIGENCLIGAGSLVTMNTVIPPGHLAFGNPAKVIRPLTEEEIGTNTKSALGYCIKGERYFKE